MAEWGLLILIVAILGITYALTRGAGDTRQVAIAWIVAVLIIATGLVFYVASKVGRVEQSLPDIYRIDESP